MKSRPPSTLPSEEDGDGDGTPQDYRSPDCSGVNPLELLHEHGNIPNPLHFLQHQRSNNDPLTC